MDEKTLAVYYDLVEQLYDLDPGSSEEKAWVPCFVAASPVYFSNHTAIIIEKLQSDATQQFWYSPRQSWALARVAYAMAQKLNQDVILSKCGLTLAIALNTLGHFVQAIPLLKAAISLFLSHGQAEQVCRCNNELALACIYQDDFETARIALEQVKSLLPAQDSPYQQAQYYRVEGLFHLVQNRYQDAAKLLQQAEQLFVRMKCPVETALTRCDLADTLLYTDPHAALEWLDQARNVPVLATSRVHAARCDNIQAFIYTKLNRYEESLPLYRQAQLVFTQEGMSFWAARCDLDWGIAHYRLNQYEIALRLYNRARAAFAAQGINSRTAMCDLNIGNVYYDMNRYREALTLYQRVAETARAEGRLLRAARCDTNMGLCYSQLGQYNQALVLHKRAERAFREAGDAVFVATSQENLAGTYRALGRYDQALAYYQSAQQTFVQNQLIAYAAYCNMQMADLYLTLDQLNEAKRCLTNARQLYEKTEMTAYQAACNRRLALVIQAMGETELAIIHLNQARQFFTAMDMPVEMALCDLVEGKLKLATDQIQQAESLFQQAQAVLLPGFPDQAWLALEGLALCALTRGDQQSALEHYLLATNLINQVRDVLPTEQLSSDFFAGRQHIFYAAIDLALALGAREQALKLAQECKASSFFRQQHLWAVKNESQNDPYVTHLLEQANDLRQLLDALRIQIIGQDRQDKSLCLPLRGTEESPCKKLSRLSHTYEEVIEQLRLVAPSTATEASPFSVAAFRKAAATHLSGKWMCLEYFLIEDQLLIFYLDTQSLQVYPQQLSLNDRWILQQCVSSEPERRELIYQDTIRGFFVPDKPGQTYRWHLSQLLLPPEILETTMWDILILAPHGMLHGLPFQGLLEEDEITLLERGPIHYVPSLQVLLTLWEHEVTVTIGTRSLVCGLETFGRRAKPLPNAGKEVQVVVDSLSNDPKILYESEATVANLKRMSANGELAQYDLVHFATHTVTEPGAPLLSRVLLADSDLTVADILELKMSARLVVLSTCHSAVGEIKPGDEMMTLARAFFYAGAEAVVASLWAVEDEATAALMQHFYQQLQIGGSIYQALRHAQHVMKQDGYTAYQWAPFVVIGRP